MSEGTAAATGTAAYRTAERAFWAREGLEPTDRWVDVGTRDRRVRIQDVGSGTPAVFVHGTGGSGTYFAALISHMDGVRAIVIDRPGWGLSDPLDFSARPYREIAADVVRRVLDTLGIERAHVVGASIGNLWALRFAQAAPDRVDRMALLGGAPISPDVAVPPFIKLLRTPIGRVIVALPEKPGMFRKQLAQMGHGTTLRSSGALDAFVEWHGFLTRETQWGRNERDMVRSIVTRDGFVSGLVPTMEEMGSITTPTLMVYGDADPVGSLEIWERFVRSMPAAELDVVPAAGHVVWLDDPARVGSVVSEFLSA
jgi:2-hydroxy-6-oxonona-2,4-dienedioate hydrolase